MNKKALNKLIFICVYSLINLDFDYCQLLTSLNVLRKVKISDCNQTNEYFDISKLTCSPCPANSVPASGMLNFCFSYFYFISNNPIIIFLFR
jgi:hypothetical protein